MVAMVLMSLSSALLQLPPPKELEVYGDASTSGLLAPNVQRLDVVMSTMNELSQFHREMAEMLSPK